MITRIRRRFRVVAPDETGVTLVELIVSMALLAVLSTLIVGTFTSFSGTLTRDRVATENTNIATVGMNELTRIVRASTSIPMPNGAADLVPFVGADNESITIYAYIDTDSVTPKPIKIQFAVDPVKRELIETRWNSKPRAGYPTYWDFEATEASKRVIARQIVLPAANEQPLFTYYKVDPTSLQAVKLPVPTSGGLSATDRAKIAVVEVRINVQSDPTKRAAPVIIVNRVGIPNLGISRLGSP